jgi:hypothetical protein
MRRYLPTRPKQSLEPTAGRRDDQLYNTFTKFDRARIDVGLLASAGAVAEPLALDVTEHQI